MYSITISYSFAILLHGSLHSDFRHSRVIFIDVPCVSFRDFSCWFDDQYLFKVFVDINVAENLGLQDYTILSSSSDLLSYHGPLNQVSAKLWRRPSSFWRIYHFKPLRCNFSSLHRVRNTFLINCGSSRVSEINLINEPSSNASIVELQRADATKKDKWIF